MTACEPPCALLGGRAESLCPTRGFQDGFGPILGALLDKGYGGQRGAGESLDAFMAPGRSLPPAVRTVSENGSRRFYSGQNIRLTLFQTGIEESPTVVGVSITLIYSKEAYEQKQESAHGLAD